MQRLDGTTITIAEYDGLAVAVVGRWVELMSSLMVTSGSLEHRQGSAGLQLVGLQQNTIAEVEHPGSRRAEAPR